MGERGLTYKQQRFAELVASGCTNVGAFRSVYTSVRRGKATESEGAKRVAHLPKVVAEVQRLTLLRSPHDAAAQSEHIAARLLELTKSPEPEVALRAIAQWAELEKRGLLRPRPIEQSADSGRRPSADDRRQIIDQLRALYQKALPKPQNFAEQLGQPITELPKPHDLAIDVELTDTASTVTPQAMAVDDASCEPSPVDNSMKRPEPIKKFGLAPIPGYFPPRFRRV